MSARFTDSMSLRSSATEEDLEEARLRLLNHMDRDVDAGRREVGPGHRSSPCDRIREI